MEEVISDGKAETKAVKFSDKDEGLKFPMMLTAFDGDGQAIYEEAGYRGRYVLFTLIEGGVQDAFTDPFKMSHPHATDALLDFCLAVRSGWRTGGDDGIAWERISDGDVIAGDHVPDGE